MTGGSVTGRWRRVLLGGLALGLVVACSAEPDQPGTLPPDPPSASSTSASPSPATPEEEVEATMRAYFVAVNAMFRSGDVEPLRAFSTNGCSCRQITDSVEKVTMEGGRYKGARYVVRSVRVHDLEARSAAVEVMAKVPPYKVVDGEGKVTENSQGGALHTDFSMVKRGETWIIGNAFNLE